MTSIKQQQSEELRQQGNNCVKANNFNEAIIHYSHALRLDAQNHLLYSNRSFAFLKLQQYYFAMEDAKQVIKLQPSWPKGFYRKGEVEYQVGHYTSAVISYGQALLMDPSNKEVREAFTRTNKEIGKIKKKAARQPWLFCGGGAVLGFLIVLADQFLAKQPSITFILLQLLLVLIFAGLGYLAMKVNKYIQDSEKRSLLEPPVDLLEEMGQKSEENNDNTTEMGQKSEENNDKEQLKQTETKPHRKGGVSAGRQRFKKGKS